MDSFSQHPRENTQEKEKEPNCDCVTSNLQHIHWKIYPIALKKKRKKLDYSNEEKITISLHLMMIPTIPRILEASDQRKNVQSVPKLILPIGYLNNSSLK